MSISHQTKKFQSIISGFQPGKQDGSSNKYFLEGHSEQGTNAAALDLNLDYVKFKNFSIQLHFHDYWFIFWFKENSNN